MKMVVHIMNSFTSSYIPKTIDIIYNFLIIKY